MLAPTLRPRGWKTAIAIQLFVTAAALAYWGLWFSPHRGLIASQDTDVYLAFQNAFPVADGFLVFACLAGAHALIRFKSTALLWVLLASSSSLYLGALDIAFNFQNRVYSAPTGSMAIEVALNLMSLGFGGWGVWFGWSNRHSFLGQERA